jgi:hypothetical protein
MLAATLFIDGSRGTYPHWLVLTVLHDPLLG